MIQHAEHNESENRERKRSLDGANGMRSGEGGREGEGLHEVRNALLANSSISFKRGSTAELLSRVVMG